MCFSRSWRHIRKGCLDKSLGLQHLFTPLPPWGLCPGLQIRDINLSLPISPPNPLTIPNGSICESNKKSAFCWLECPQSLWQQSKPVVSSPKGIHSLPGLSAQTYVSPKQCYSQELDNSPLSLHGPELPFPQLNEAWICSTKGFASVFYWPCCGEVLTQKYNSFSLLLSPSLYVYISNGSIRTATREFQQF